MPEQPRPENFVETSAAQDAADTEDEVVLLDALVVLAKHKKGILGLPFLFTVVVAGLTLLATNIYTATTKILPPQQNQSGASAILAQFAGLAGLAGGAATAIKNPNDIYVAMLKSRTVADNLIQRFDLMKLYDAKYLSRARKALEQVTKITSGKDGIIVIEVDDKDPKRAADIANAYVEELLKLTQVLAVTEASQRRLFFERQLVLAKDNLIAAEVAARQGLQKGGLAQVDAQGRSMIEVTARLRAQISGKEVQLGAMRTFAAEGNPELQRAQQELEALRRELARVEGSSPVAAARKGDMSGNAGLENLGRLRDVKYYELLYELLAKQYELARLDEAKDSAVIQVMDKAIEPDFKSKPTRWLIVVISALVSFLTVILWVLIREAIARAGSNPAQRARLQILKRHLFAWGRNA